MSDISLDAPKAAQSVKFGERYVSAALNRKMAGIIDTGVYRSFEVRPVGDGVAGYVYVTNSDPDVPSVALVEENGYSLTVFLERFCSIKRFTKSHKIIKNSQIFSIS